MSPFVRSRVIAVTATNASTTRKETGMPQHLKQSPRRTTGITQPSLLAQGVRHALLVMVVAGSIGGQPLALAAEAVVPTVANKIYAIPAGPLGEALTSFASRAGVSVQVDARLIEGVRTQGLSGTHSVLSGLARLLQGTDLEAQERSPGTYVLRVLPKSARNNEPTLAPVTVRASEQIENASGPVIGYIAKRSATATKTDTAIIETPQSISVVTAEQIETLKSPSLTEALGYSAGVLHSEDVDSTRDQMRVRGFDLDAEYGSYFRDGLKYNVNGFNGQQEPYGLERIELLRGASSVLYGLSAPGGLVNTVSKRPTKDPLHELNLEIGSYNRKQVSGDFGGALTEDGAWSYRLTALRRDSDTFIDDIPDNRTYIAPALAWQNATNSLTLLSEYQHDRSAYNPGLPQSGTLLSNSNGRLPSNRYLGEPDIDKYDNKRYSVGYLYEHAFNDTLKLRHSLRYFHNQNDYVNTWIGELDSDERTTLSRGVNKRHDESSATAADTSLQYQWHHGRVKHTSLLGFDYTQAKHQSERYAADIASIDVYAPTYGASPGTFSYQDYSWKAQSTRMGVYVQDQMKFADRWVMTFGGRQDDTQDKSCAFADASNCPVNNEKSNAFTGRAGLVYLADNGLAPFLSFSQSWEPTTGVSRSGTRFSPTKGEQYELGLRYQPKGSATMLSAAIYQLTRTNVLVDDPLNTSLGDYFQVQQGEVRSRGIELEAKTSLNRNTTLIASYAYTDARTLKSSPLTPEQDGRRTGGVPYNQFSLWGEYAFGAFGFPGLKFGAGARYVGETIGTWTDLETPAYTVFDAMSSYSTGPWRFALNISNLADKTYVALCPYRCFYGERRKVIVSGTYRW
jgi:iron complex outermembrane recepter protein